MAEETTTPAAPAIAMQPVKSTMLKAIGYDAGTKTLAAEFVKGGVYHHPGVPPELFAGMLAADSVGQFYRAHVMGKYKGAKP